MGVIIVNVIKTLPVIFILFSSSITLSVYAYEVETHSEISKIASEMSILNNPNAVLLNLGLRPVDLESQSQKFLNSKGESSTIMELIRFGARNEDLETFNRALSHFYDPAYDRALTYLKIVWGLKTPDWAMENPDEWEVIAGTLKHPPPVQRYSFSDANKRHS